jgi:insertion element IS1 protein InsB
MDRQHLARLSDDELAKLDIAAVNLACAVRLPGVPAFDPAEYTSRLDRWADEIETFTWVTLESGFRVDPEKFPFPADELWSFVGDKGQVCWVWAALDADTRQVVGMVVGDRSEGTARRLWDVLPCRYRDRAIGCTDFWTADLAAIPSERHAAGGKDAGITCHAERFWCTVRQRCARLVRKTLSFAKCPHNHLGALWYFIRLYNRSRSCRP